MNKYRNGRTEFPQTKETKRREWREKSQVKKIKVRGKKQRKIVLGKNGEETRTTRPK